MAEAGLEPASASREFTYCEPRSNHKSDKIRSCPQGVNSSYCEPAVESQTVIPSRSVPQPSFQSDSRGLRIRCQKSIPRPFGQFLLAPGLVNIGEL